MLEDNRRQELLRQTRLVADLAAQPPGLPAEVQQRVEQVAALLGEAQPDVARLALLGHALMAWHQDQGFAEVPVHAAVAALAMELVRLQPA